MSDSCRSGLLARMIVATPGVSQIPATDSDRSLRAIKMSSWQLSLLASAYIAAANNRLLFAGLDDRLDFTSVHGLGYILLIGVALIASLNIFFLAVGTRHLMKPVIIAIILISSLLGYFTQQMGVVFDTEMMRNIAETIRDHNQNEALELLSYSMFVHVTLFGAVPAAVVLFTEVIYKSSAKEFFLRLAYSGGLLALLAVLVVVNLRWGTYFTIENRDLRLYVTPHYALASLQKYLKERRADDQSDFQILGADAIQEKKSPLRTIGILIVGETARADHFSLNGYERKTNPLLERENVISFSNVFSCGTTTAFSIPCMFSLQGRDHYSPDAAKMESNVLDVLDFAGVKVVWIDANSSCKSVCDRIENVNYLNSPDASMPLNNAGDYYDEVLLSKLNDYIASTTSDILIVLHTMGSHGPAYYKRYPEHFAVFQPECRDRSPQSCDMQDIENAYDNTIVYTDYVLSKVIDTLRDEQPLSDSFLLYASDHGESLGEDGVYLHGLPYYLAPKSQTNVPMIVWFSNEYAAHHGIKLDDEALRTGGKYSHDNISHTLLGLYDVKSNSYNRDLDIFSHG